MLTKRIHRILFWAAIIAAALIGVVIAVSGIITDQGTPWIKQPGVLIGTVIAGFSGFAAMAFPIMLRTEKWSHAVREQVENEHDGGSGLRDDIDHANDKLTHLTNLMEGQHSDTRGLRKDIGRVMDITLSNAERLTTVEHTQTNLLTRVANLEDTQPATKGNQ